jgi:DNA-directed RNA polymerase specialized sigma24 family protein
MLSTDEGSVTRWLGDLKAGGGAAVQHLCERYLDRLVALARRKLRGRGGGSAEDAEDAALSAFDSFCRRAAIGQFPRLDDRDDLWRLLAKITIRKAVGQIQRECAAKRGGGRVVSEGDLADEDEAGAGGGLDRFMSPGPGHIAVSMFVEEYRRLRSRLGDDSLRLVLDLSLEGYRRAEIADRLGCAIKTVGRKLDVIRTLWLDEEGRS